MYDWFYARTFIDAPKNGDIFKAEIFDISRAGMRVRLLENGASAFIPENLFLLTKNVFKVIKNS